MVLIQAMGSSVVIVIHSGRSLGTNEVIRVPALLFSRNQGRSTWVLSALLASGGVAWVLAPVVLLHPFRAQSALGVSLAYELRRSAPLATLAGLALLLPLVVRLGRRVTRRWQWLPIAALALAGCASAWFARQNHFEWMFNPVPKAEYARAGSVDFVGDRDMVVAVENHGDAVAWPVRQMAYHHLVQDTVGGVPLVSTY
jgi:hypothetical protein